MQDSPILILYEVGLLIVIASLASEFVKRLRLPGLIGAIIVGMFIGGPGGLGIVTDLAVVNVLAVLGSVLILFMVGLEFEASAFWRVGGRAFLLTTVGMGASALGGYLIGLWLGWSSQAALLLGAVIAPSGTSVIAFTLSTEGKVETKVGSTLLTACVVDDVEGVLLLSIALGLVAKEAYSLSDLFYVSAISGVFIISSIYLGGRLLPSVIYRFEKILSDEVLFMILLGLGMVLAFAATQLGLAAITGAFIMGAIIPYRKLGEKLAHRLFFMKELFAAIFFTSIGLRINPFDIPLILPIALLILVLAISTRIGGGAIGGVISGFRGKILLAMILGLAIRAEMSLIIAREGVAAGIVGAEFLAITASVVIGSMILALPFFIKLSAHRS